MLFYLNETIHHVIYSIYLSSVYTKNKKYLWQIITYNASYNLIHQHTIYLFTYLLTLYIMSFYKVLYKVVTEARFARRPTGGRLYTHPIQKINHRIVCREMSRISWFELYCILSSIFCLIQKIKNIFDRL